ncbi:MAG: EI24 domain-containing protein, partial [Saprospiraceae bacterium]
GASVVSVLTPWQWANETTILSFIIGLGLIVGFILIMKYILLIAMSPLLSYISEKAEKSIHTEYNIRGFSAATSAARSVRINMRNMVKEIILTILLLIAGLIPGLNVIAIPLLFIVQAYFTGFGIMDFYLERHMTFRETLGEVYRHKYASIILGGIFMLLFAIPVLGAIVAPYLTTVAGTQYFLKNRLNLQPTT